MSEETMYRWLMISTAVLAVLCGLGAVALMVLCAITFSVVALAFSLLLAGGAVACGYITVFFSAKITTPKVFNNQDEKEVLTTRQRRELRRARSEVVLEKALIEVEHERENIVHNQMLEAGDQDKPPYETRWTDDPKVKQIRPGGWEEEHRR